MTDDHKDLLKKLVEAPYGKAQEILKAKGLWDEKKDAGDPDQMKTYIVRVQGHMAVSARVRVEAKNDEEACEKACEIAENPTFAWSDYGGTEAWDAEIKERLS